MRRTPYIHSRTQCVPHIRSFSLIRSPTHSLIHSHSFNHTFVHSLTHPPTHSFIHSFIHSHSFTHTLVHSLIGSPTHLFILSHLFVLSFALIRRAKAELRGHLRAAVENVLGTVFYRFLDPKGHRFPKVSEKHPLVPA